MAIYINTAQTGAQSIHEIELLYKQGK